MLNYGGGGDTTTPRGILPVTPVAGEGVYGSGSDPGTPPPSGQPQGPDPPPPGTRVSIRPQPMRAPRDEVVALGPLRGREPALPVAGGPTPEWGGGGMARGTTAAALRLSRAPGMDRTVAMDPPPPSPPTGSSSVHGADRQRVPPDRGARGVGCAAAGGEGEPTPAPADPRA